ncbi:MAG: YdbL family protein [Gammaproteobacteria bacterium]|nr:YdbL family protein [Gammaproteobacteria bacterium]
MKLVKRLSLLGACFGAAACVTVNVYFPAAAAENAADRFVKEVYGRAQDDAPPAQTAPAPAGDGSSARDLPLHERVAAALLDAFVPRAAAQEPDITIATPAIRALQDAMTARHARLQPHYASGSIGMAANGLLTLRDAKAVPIRERAGVNALIADENRDRNQLYAEVAKANGHPEWEARIRDIFARRWVANAPGGWWFQDQSGAWQQH